MFMPCALVVALVGPAWGQASPNDSGLSLAELRRVTPTLDAKAGGTVLPVALLGSCSAGAPILPEGSLDPEGVHPIGELTAYSRIIRIRNTDSGFVRARADAQWSADDLRNLLGYLPAGSTVSAEGPLKNAAFSAGIGYAVPVRDLAGKTCRAYLSQTVVEEVLPGR